MAKSYLELQQKLRFDELMAFLSAELESIPDHRVGNATKYVLADVLKSAFAMFSLKSPSLLDFKKQTVPEASNPGSIYQVMGAIPFGKGKMFLNSAPKALDYIVGGWQINTVWQLQSGLPFTPSYRNCNADRDTGWRRPDLVGDWRQGNPTRNAWFKITSVPLTANGQTDGPWRRPARGTFGNVGRNRLLGPGFSQWDMSFFKSFAITERVKAQFRAESFNFANHMNLANPNTCVDCPGSAGRITDLFRLATPRQWQFGLRLEY